MMSLPTRWRKNCSDVTTALSPLKTAALPKRARLMDELMAKKGYFYALYTVAH